MERLGVQNEITDKGLADNEQLESFRLKHDVRPDLKELVGIPEDADAAFCVHVASKHRIESIKKYGFVNVSNRGTLSDLAQPGEYESNPQIGVIASSMLMDERNLQKEIGIVSFCLPSDKIKQDPEKYGLWFDNRLPEGEYPELWEIYNNIPILYDDQTGEPKMYAIDDPNLYPVFIPPSYILGVV